MILGFLLTALYVPGISGAATTPRWGLLAIGIPLLLLNRGGGKFTLVHLFGALFLAWSAVSIAWSPNQLDSFNQLILWVILAQAFVYGSQLEDLSPTFRGMAYGLLLSSVVIIISIWLPDFVLHYTPYAGLFINSGSLAEITALVLIGLLYDGRGLVGRAAVPGIRGWNWHGISIALGLLPCIILPESRGAWLALVAAFTALLWFKSKLSALVLVALTALCITYSFHIGFHTESVIQRLGMWHDAIGALTWRGHGLGSLWTDYPPLASAIDIYKERPEHLHNDFLEVMFEIGPIGFAGMLALVCGCIWNTSGTARLVFAGLFAESLVGFPLHMPCTGFVAALCLGHLARSRADIRDILRSRRILLCPSVASDRCRANDNYGSEGGGGVPAGASV